MKWNWINIKTKKQIKKFCLDNKFGEIRFSGKNKAMYADLDIIPDRLKILQLLANRIGYILHEKNIY